MPLYDLEIVNGEAVVRELTPEEVAALQSAERRQLRKSTVTSRLIAMGKAGDVKTAFDQDPEAFFRWVSPDWPNVFADDEGLLAFLAGLGLTQEQIAVVTA